MQQPTQQPSSAHHVSIVIHCLKTGDIDECVGRARGVLADRRLPGEVIVVTTARRTGAPLPLPLPLALARRSCTSPRRGYGPRTSLDFAAADGDHIVMIDGPTDRSAWALIWAARTCAT